MLRRLRAAGEYWVEDGASQMGAAVAYYALFSLAPLLVLALGVAGQVYGEEEARGRFVGKVRSSIDEDSAQAVQSMLDNFRRPPGNFWPAVIGGVTMLYGSLGLFTAMHASLHRIWRLAPPANQGVIFGWVKGYLLAFLMVQVVCGFLLLLLSTSTFLAVLRQWGEGILPGDAWSWQMGNLALSVLLVTLLVAFTFRFMSDGRLPYRQLWGGAFVTAVLFSVGKVLLGEYLARAQIGSAYGAAGSLVVFLTWVYYSAPIFYFGAVVVRAGREGQGGV